MRERIGDFRGEACHLGLAAQFSLNETIPPVPSGRLTATAVDGAERQLGQRVLLVVARLDSREREKGYDLVIEALPALIDEYPDVQVVLVGQGDDQGRAESIARACCVADRVFCLGFVPNSLLAELYHRSYAFILPSRQEGFGLVYLEAMNYGKPCVGCAEQGAEDVIVHGETGFLLRTPEIRAELATVLRLLLADADLGRRLGIAGFQRLHRLFKPERFREQVKAAVLTAAC